MLGQGPVPRARRGLAVILVAIGLIVTGAADASAEPLTLELQVSGLGDRDITVTQDSKERRRGAARD